LSTARGSGTNGYVQTNKAALRPGVLRRPQYDAPTLLTEGAQSYAHRAPNAEIIRHERRKAVENRCLALRDRLEDGEEGLGLTPAEIDARVADLREKLLARVDAAAAGADDLVDLAGANVHDTHLLAEAKRLENEKLAAAFNIDAKSYVAGAAFNQELQEQKRRERIAERDRAEEERKKRLEEEETVRKKAIKQAEKEREKAEKARKKAEKEAKASKEAAAKSGSAPKQ
ncbi:RNA-splicing factor, partial [Cladochytrium tenue]